MANDDKKEGLNRRGFLAGATAAGLAAVPLSKTSRVEAQDSDGASAPLPNSMDAAMEHDIPEGYSDEQAANYFVHHPGSDYMVDVLRRRVDGRRAHTSRHVGVGFAEMR